MIRSSPAPLLVTRTKYPSLCQAKIKDEYGSSFAGAFVCGANYKAAVASCQPQPEARAVLSAQLAFQRLRKVAPRSDRERLERQPRRHRSQLAGQRGSNDARSESVLDVGRVRDQGRRLPIGFEVNACRKAIAHQERQHVVAVDPLRTG